MKKFLRLIVLIISLIGLVVIALVVYSVVQKKTQVGQVEKLFSDREYLAQNSGLNLTIKANDACRSIFDYSKKYDWEATTLGMYSDGGSSRYSYSKANVSSKIEVFCKWDMVAGKYIEADIKIK